MKIQQQCCDIFITNFMEVGMRDREKARQKANETLKEVKKAMMLNYFE